MNVYTLFAVSINGTLIQGIKNVGLSTNLSKRINTNDGNARARYVAAMSRGSTITFSSVEVANVLAAIGTEGVAISSSVILFWQLTQANGQRASGANHIKMTVSSGIVVPRRASASQDGEAEISAEIFPVSSDGSTDPITIAGSQSLSGSPSVAQKFTVGPASFNGSNVSAQSIEIDFGVTVKTAGHSGFPYPMHAYTSTVKPSITVSTLDLTALTSIGLTGTAQTTTDSTLYFRKLDENGTRVADITAEHCKFTLDQGHFNVENPSAGDDGDATCTIKYDATYDDTNAPIVFAAAAIT